MLTIIVIMKPAYSITKSRNRDRLLGTLLGAAIGVLILVIVKDKHLMIGFMIVLMVLAYSFMRTRYLLFVTLMTPYILILLYILNPLHFKDLILDRVSIQPSALSLPCWRTSCFLRNGPTGNSPNICNRCWMPTKIILST